MGFWLSTNCVLGKMMVAKVVVVFLAKTLSRKN
jgi:hypothetical protein